MALLWILSYVALLGAFAFVTLSLASGLLYLSELIEEYSRPAKVWGQRGIYTIVALHLVLLVTDSLPILQTLFSIICHVVYLQTFSNTWPLISLSSASFIASCIMVIVNHFMWFFHFSHLSQAARGTRYYTGPRLHSIAEITTFFVIFVWLAPLFLFLSLSANDSALPMSSGSDINAVPTSPSKQVFQPPTSLFGSIFSGIMSRGSKFQKAKAFVTREQPTSIIAPPPKSPYLSTPAPLSPAMYSTLSPPRSPALRDPSFQLSTPPRRRSYITPENSRRSPSPF